MNGHCIIEGCGELECVEFDNRQYGGKTDKEWCDLVEGDGEAWFQVPQILLRDEHSLIREMMYNEMEGNGDVQSRFALAYPWYWELQFEDRCVPGDYLYAPPEKKTRERLLQCAGVDGSIIGELSGEELQIASPVAYISLLEDQDNEFLQEYLCTVNHCVDYIKSIDPRHPCDIWAGIPARFDSDRAVLAALLANHEKYFEIVPDSLKSSGGRFLADDFVAEVLAQNPSAVHHVDPDQMTEHIVNASFANSPCTIVKFPVHLTSPEMWEVVLKEYGGLYEEMPKAWRCGKLRNIAIGSTMDLKGIYATVPDAERTHELHMRMLARNEYSCEYMVGMNVLQWRYAVWKNPFLLEKVPVEFRCLEVCIAAYKSEHSLKDPQGIAALCPGRIGTELRLGLYDDDEKWPALPTSLFS